MTTPQSPGVTVTERFTQDGWDWPNGHHDEQCWPLEAVKPMAPYFREQQAQCWCHTCRPLGLDRMEMILCPDCGNKRCPKAKDHRNGCTNSNDLGQAGSAYP